jgi:hypothetical protein
VKNFSLPHPKKDYIAGEEAVRNREITSHFMHVQQEIGRIKRLISEVSAGATSVFVSKNGNDANDGLTEAYPKLTIGAAITVANALIAGGAPGSVVHILDAGVYTESFTIAATTHVLGPAATVAGQITLTSNASVTLQAHYAASTNQIMLVKSGGSGISYYVANRSDGRGISGTLTGTQNFQNVSSGSVLFIRVGVCYVAQGGVGLGDVAAGFGHIHFWTPDL